MEKLITKTVNWQTCCITPSRHQKDPVRMTSYIRLIGVRNTRYCIASDSTKLLQDLESWKFQCPLRMVKGVMTWAKCPHLFVDSEGYHEQMGPLPNSNGSLDIALFKTHTFQTINMHQNWPRGRKLTQSCWC